MKRLVFALALSASVIGSTALAADIAAPALVPPPIYVSSPLVYDWTGFYIGGNLGLGWNSGSFADPFGNTFSPNTGTQFLGGGQVGLNYQFNNGVLVGAEADFDWLANSSNSASTITLMGPSGASTGGNTASVTVNNRSLTTITGRVGWAWDRVLLYGKGGGAWVGANNPTVTINGAPATISTSNNNWGWTAGLGAEWAFWGNWSARVEYDFVGLSQTFTLLTPVPPVGSGTATIPAGDQFAANNRNIQMVNVGINYKFGPWWW